MRKRVYVAGPMRGLPDFNFPAFDAASKELEALGYEVLNPAEIDRRSGIAKDPTGDASGIDLDPIIRRDIDALLTCDTVVLLPGWEESNGAKAEVAAAIWKGGYKFFTYPKMAEIKIDLQPETIPDCTIIGFHGYAGSGKDAAAEGFERLGWEKLGFADPMYEIASILNPVLFWFVVPFTLRFAVRRLGWTRAKRIPAVRRYLQVLGTECGREVIGKDVWVNALVGRMRSGGRYIVTNVRHHNEADALRKRGAAMIGISRPGFGPVNAHSSDNQAIPVDCEVVNDGTKASLYQNVRTAWQRIIAKK